ncbi:MAG: nuclear transport factor 2 family protein [Dongiaceae bacterium]
MRSGGAAGAALVLCLAAATAGPAAAAAQRAAAAERAPARRSHSLAAAARAGREGLAGRDAKAEADAAAIRAALEGWTADFNAGRADRVCDLFAPDLQSRFRGAPPRGFEALCSNMKRALADPQHRYANRLELLEIIVSGDLAAVRLIWHGTVRDVATGQRPARRSPAST